MEKKFRMVLQPALRSTNPLNPIFDMSENVLQEAASIILLGRSRPYDTRRVRSLCDDAPRSDKAAQWLVIRPSVDSATLHQSEERFRDIGMHG